MTRTPALLVAFALAACGDNTSAPAAGPAETPAPAAASPDASAPAPDAAAAPSTPGVIPPEFRHVWAIEQADCAGDPALTRITITGDGVDFYEGRSSVVSASVPHEGALTMEVDHTAEGQTERQTHTLAIDDETGKLSYARGGQAFDYTRCG